MSRERRGVQGIRTMGALVDSRRTRTAAGALLELSAMANEKLLLHKELERWKSRHAEIRRRLAEIAAKEQRLMLLVQMPPAGASAVGEADADAVDGSVEESTFLLAVEPVQGRRVRLEELTY